MRPSGISLRAASPAANRDPTRRDQRRPDNLENESPLDLRQLSPTFSPGERTLLGDPGSGS